MLTFFSGEIPAPLKGLTEMETMMISLHLPIMQVRYTQGGQLSYKEHVCNFVQDVAHVAATLPRMPEECDIVIIRRESVDLTNHVDFIVRREKVINALREKIRIDPAYSHIDLNDAEVVARLNQLPENGSMADRIPTCRPGVQNPGNAPPAPEAAGPTEAANSEVDEVIEGDIETSGVPNLGVHGLDEVENIRARAANVLNGPVQYERRDIVSSMLDKHFLAHLLLT